MSEVQKPEYTYDTFLSDAACKGFTVEPADFGGLRLSVYSRNDGSKTIYFSDTVDLTQFIADLYGNEITFGVQ